METTPIAVMLFDQFKEFILTATRQPSGTIEGEDVYEPELDDLYSLYTKVRNNKVIAIMEFGSGWPTLALAKALDENRVSYSQYVIENIRHPNPFTLMTVDCSRQFQALALKRISQDLADINIIPVISEARMTTLNGQVCSLFDSIPPFTADFIYLDGPDCDQVVGDVNGFSVRFGTEKFSYGLPMAADLILLEPFFGPALS